MWNYFELRFSLSISVHFTNFPKEIKVTTCKQGSSGKTVSSGPKVHSAEVRNRIFHKSFFLFWANDCMATSNIIDSRRVTKYIYSSAMLNYSFEVLHLSFSGCQVVPVCVCVYVYVYVLVDFGMRVSSWWRSFCWRGRLKCSRETLLHESACAELLFLFLLPSCLCLPLYFCLSQNLLLSLVVVLVVLSSVNIKWPWVSVSREPTLVCICVSACVWYKIQD